MSYVLSAKNTMDGVIADDHLFVSTGKEAQEADDMDDNEFSDWVRKCPDIATALKGLRVTQSQTLEEVGQMAGLSKAYVDRLEHGERHPGRDALIALLLAAFSLPVPQANLLLLKAGYAPLHHTLWWDLWYGPKQ